MNLKKLMLFSFAIITHYVILQSYHTIPSIEEVRFHIDQESRYHVHCLISAAELTACDLMAQQMYQERSSLADRFYNDFPHLSIREINRMTDSHIQQVIAQAYEHAAVEMQDRLGNAVRYTFINNTTALIAFCFFQDTEDTESARFKKWIPRWALQEFTTEPPTYYFNVQERIFTLTFPTRPISQ